MQRKGKLDGIAKEVHQGVQTGCGATNACGGTGGLGGAQSGSEPPGTVPLEPRCRQIHETSYYATPCSKSHVAHGASLRAFASARSRSSRRAAFCARSPRSEEH